MAEKFDNVNILLGVTGGIAAYKAADLASKLTSSGAKVRTIMTAGASELICAKTFEAVTGNAVYTSLWSGPENFKIGHIELGQWADIVVVAPATADIIGKTACGICDDLLSTTLCGCWQKPIVFAPAMNSNMWSNPIVQGNVKKLVEVGVKMVGPEEGRLACGTSGPGRMSEPSKIMDFVFEIISNR